MSASEEEEEDNDDTHREINENTREKKWWMRITAGPTKPTCANTKCMHIVPMGERHLDTSF
mgnify:CR=1 FL=1